MFGLPIAPGLTWPVVDPGGLAPWTELDNPDALPVEFDSPDTLPVEEAPPDMPADPPAVPRAPPACASAIELESASAPAITIVASRMIVSLVVELNRQPSETIDVPATVREFSPAPAIGPNPPLKLENYFASVGRIRIRHRFQMRSITAKLVVSAFSPSPAVR